MRRPCNDTKELPLPQGGYALLGAARPEGVEPPTFGFEVRSAVFAVSEEDFERSHFPSEEYPPLVFARARC